MPQLDGSRFPALGGFLSGSVVWLRQFNAGVAVGVACAVLASGAAVCRAELVTFHVGNSLTAQLLGPNYDTRLQAISQVEGVHAIRNRNDIRANQNLTFFVSQPAPDGSATGYYPDAFANLHLDVLFLQPWYNATIRQEASAAAELVRQLRLNPANTNTRILIYSTWGAHSLTQPFRDAWTRTDIGLDSPFIPNAIAVDLFMGELRKTVPQAELIPAGGVFYEIADRMQKGQTIPGIPAFENLYADSVHPTNAGAYAACLTTYAVLYGKSPVGLGYPTQMLDPSWGYVLPAEGCLPLQNLVADVVAVPEPTAHAHASAIMAVAGIGLLMRRRHSIKTVICLTWRSRDRRLTEPSAGPRGRPPPGETPCG